MQEGQAEMDRCIFIGQNHAVGDRATTLRQCTATRGPGRPQIPMAALPLEPIFLTIFTMSFY